MINLPADVVLDKLIRTMNANKMFEISTVPNEMYEEMGKARLACLPVSSKGGRLVRSMSLDPMVCHCWVKCCEGWGTRDVCCVGMCREGLCVEV